MVFTSSSPTLLLCFDVTVKSQRALFLWAAQQTIPIALNFNSQGEKKLSASCRVEELHAGRIHETVTFDILFM
jgi:hypothetical protein